MSIWENLFRKKRVNEPKDTIAVANSKKSKSTESPSMSAKASTIKEKAQSCLELQQAGDWQGAFQIIFEAMEKYPDNEDVTRMTFGALVAGEKKIPREIWDNRQLDSFFCECDRCRVGWFPRTFATAKVMGSALGGLSVINAIGIMCQSCRVILCRNCYKSVCPNCGSKDFAIPEPNGRRRLRDCGACHQSYPVGEAKTDLLDYETHRSLCLKHGLDPADMMHVRCPHCGASSLVLRDHRKDNYQQKCGGCSGDFSFPGTDIKRLETADPYLCLKQGLDPKRMVKVVCPHCGAKCLVSRDLTGPSITLP